VPNNPYKKLQAAFEPLMMLCLNSFGSKGGLHMNTLTKNLVSTAFMAMAITAYAKVPGDMQNQIVAQVNRVSAAGIEKSIGTVTFSDSNQGLVIIPDLSGLAAGNHGFHIHEYGSCAPGKKDGKIGAAIAAGEHYNPTNVHHGTPMNGHLGDLPVLMVKTNGQAMTPVLAPRLNLADVRGRTIVIHMAGDNYSDKPLPAGGGGDRIACGVIP
jgi:Cu-Zn family superoxide dismutase